MKSFLFLLSILLWPSFSFAAGDAQHLPFDSTKYKGYRLELTDFKLIKQKSDWLKIGFYCYQFRSDDRGLWQGRHGALGGI